MNLVLHDLGFSKTEERFPAKNTCLAILAARRIGLFVQHLIPPVALFRDLVPEFRIALGRDFAEQETVRRFNENCLCKTAWET